MRVVGIGSLLTAFLGFPLVSVAQNALPLPGCEPAPGIQRTLDEKVSFTALAQVKYPERYRVQRQVLDGLIAQYPRELAPYEALRDYTTFGGTKEDSDALRAQWIQGAKDHPDDPLALYLAGVIQENRNSPEAVRLLETAKAKAPDFPWPAHELAWFYYNGKRADPAKSKANTEAYFALCPASASSDFKEQWLLQKDLPLMAKVSPVLRARLQGETDLKRIEEGYKVLWAREFRYRPPAEHDAERAQITQDLKRLEALNPHGDAAWRAFLIEGYKQSGVAPESLKAMEDSLIRDFPQSNQAESIVIRRWFDAHPEPADQTDTAAWDGHYKEFQQAVKGWMHDYPDSTDIQRSERFAAVIDDDAVPEQEGIAALDLYLKSIEDYKHTGMLSYMDDTPGKFLLDHGWQPERALELLKKTSTYLGNGHSKQDYGDNLAESDLKRFTWWHDKGDLDTIGLLLRAAKAAGKPGDILNLKAAIEEQPPTEKKFLSAYWTNRARFAALENHPLDALTYYRFALDSRTETPKPYHGHVHDEVTAESHALWMAQGGSETAWVLWNKPAAGPKEATEESPWKEPSKTMPSLDLSDYAGKKWRLKDFEGKTVIVTSWATWCGPCRMELPRLEKLYEKMKDRADLQVITLNVDENPGLVAPFLKKEGYTFPVLLASSVEEVNGLIPQTWIIDAHGKWRWLQSGFDDEKTETAYEKDLLERVKITQSGQ